MRVAASCVGIGLVLATACVIAESAAATPSRVASDARAVATSPESYDGWVRSSVYVPARDGTKLALDFYLPARNGHTAKGRFPVVWTFVPYNRAQYSLGKVTPMSDAPLSLVRHGYVVAIGDVRGKGASFGTRLAPGNRAETNDAYDLTEWLAKQPWSTGKVGMTGCSYFGMTALEGARSGAPDLRAVFVGTTMFDEYGTFATGGIPSGALLDEETPINDVVPVDGDPQRTLLRAAVRGHAANTPTGKLFASAPYRNDINPYTHDDWWTEASFYPAIPTLRSNIAFYIYGGNFDVMTDQTVLLYLNLPAANPKKLLFGNWPHCETPGYDLNREKLRFFDRWLKDIHNGVMREAPVHFYVSNSEDGAEWRASRMFPMHLPRTRYFMRREEVSSAGCRVMCGGNEGQLEGDLSPKAASQQAAPFYLTPKQGHPHVVYGFPRSGVDSYSAIFTLPADETYREVIGYPTASLWMSSLAPDADVYVYLECVQRMGGTEVISRGVLRASDRKLGRAPYKMFGLPWHPSTGADVEPLVAGRPVELNIIMSPATYALRPGDRLRLAVTSRGPYGSDDPRPVPIAIYVDDEHPSSVSVPFGDTRSAAVNTVPY